MSRKWCLGGKNQWIWWYVVLYYTILTYLLTHLINYLRTYYRYPGGGCMFCYIENNVEKINAVIKAIEELNAKVYVITTDEGTK